MKERLYDFYHGLGISECEDVRLLTLREQCDTLEYQIDDILNRISDHDRYIIEAYIDLRNDLEVESIKTALRLGKRYGKSMTAKDSCTEFR